MPQLLAPLPTGRDHFGYRQARGRAMKPMVNKALILVVLYLAFIRPGLPDTLRGPAWPTMSVDLAVPIHFPGITSMIIAGGTVVSSLLSARLIDKLGVAAQTT